MAGSVNEEKPELGELEYIESSRTTEMETQNELKRDFKPRQVFMFSIACAIGTGLVIGTGTGLAKGGPGSLLLAYIIIGITVFFVMTGLGEMAAFMPMNKGFSGYASRMVDPAFGFACGWNYFFKYFIATPVNLTAAGIVIQYWRPDLNVAIWITIFGCAVVTVNFLHVAKLGETEFCLGLLKVLVMTTLILTCFILALGGGPGHVRTGFRYWKDPGAFAEHLVEGSVGRFLGFWACICQACFAYTGTEVVGMTFGETPNPRRNIPRAVKQTFWRIFTFYILGSLALGMAVPSDNEMLIGATKKSNTADASPFVVAIKLAGISVFPDVINGCLLIFMLSAACTDIYCASRTLYGLARDGQAPAIFAKTAKNGNPVWAVAATSTCICLAYMNATTSSSKGFQYLVSLVTIFAVLNWTCVLSSHIAFRHALRAQNLALSELPYVANFQPYGSYFALFMSILVVAFSGYDAFMPKFRVDLFVLKYLGSVIFLANMTWWKIVKTTKVIVPAEVDLVSGRREYQETESAMDAAWKQSIWQKLRSRFNK